MVEIVTLTANPAIDLSTEVEKLLPFYKLRCAAARRDPGGGGINVSRVLRRFGMRSLSVYPAGGSTGRLLNRLAAQEGLETLAVAIEGDTREDFSVVERETGKQFRFVLPGPSLTEEEQDAVLGSLKHLKPDYFVASGSLAPGMPSSFYAQAIKLDAVSRAKAIVDTSGPALVAALAHGVYLIKPNLRELRELADETLENETQYLRAARRLIEAERAQMVALSLAEEGALLVTRDTAWRAFAPKVTPVSTVGAGDCFLGAMLWRLASGSRLDDVLRYAVAAGTAALLAPGTELCRPSDVAKLLPDVRVQELCMV
jgi:6-phosphofructokinase 2